MKAMNDMKFLNEFTDKTELKQYLINLEQMISSCQSGIFKKKYAPIIEANKEEKKCFLSVIVRTQGKREEGLREALLCLNAQTFQDFEIILIGHKPTPSQEETIQTVLEDQDSEFRKKIRYFVLNEGGRTAPLNFGFANARGEYAAVFDDDDILAETWAEGVESCCKQSNGRLLHSYAFAQDWVNVKNMGYRAESAPSPKYCTDYQLINQLVVNKCPLMTLAFPLNMFQKLGMIFNEDLEVTEDWEYFMRLSFLCGVSDIRKATAIYRFWNNIETSATLHDQSYWDDTYRAIQEGFNQNPILLPAGNVQKIINLLTGSGGHPLSTGGGLSLSRLYYSSGTPFNDTDCILSGNEAEAPSFDIWFLFEEKRADLKALRFDLTEDGLILIKDLEIVVWLTNGEKEIIPLKSCIHNGISYQSGILFLHTDPEIVWEWSDERPIDVVHISGTLSKSLPRRKLLSYAENLWMIKERSRRKALHQKGLF